MGMTDKLPALLDPIPGGKSMVNAVDFIVNWARSNSLWPLTYGTSCCAIEMMAASMPRYDISRFGSEVFRASPRQADLIILSGTIVEKMAGPLKTLYEQMPGPKYVIAMGACTVSGGPFFYDNYSVVKGADRVIPVDVFIPGCPPRPEALLHGLMMLQKKIKGESIRTPWKEGEIYTKPAIDRWEEAQRAWEDLELIKDEQMFEARKKFQEENPEYKPYKHTRIVKEAFPEVARPEPSLPGLTHAQIWELVQQRFAAMAQPKLPDADQPMELETDAQNYHALVEFLVQEPALAMDFLFDITAIDFPEHFVVVAQLQSMRHFHRTNVRCTLPKSADRSQPLAILANVPTLCDLYPAADWKEREVFDMFGIAFTGHPDMRRLFLEDDFAGYPLRKDFSHPNIIARPY